MVGCNPIKPIIGSSSANVTYSYHNMVDLIRRKKPLYAHSDTDIQILAYGVNI
jgi:hypothetical protein